MKILMVSGHFNLPNDTIPIGGVQKHISKVTAELLRRNHEVEWCYPKEVLREIPVFNPDLVIAHDFYCFTKGIQTPQITVFHGWEGDVPPKPEIVRIRSEVEALSNYTFCVGEYLKKWYGHAPDCVLWGGVEETKPLPLPEKNSIIYLGRLDPDQNPRIAFEAFSRINCQVTVCAEGKMENEIRNYCQQNGIAVTFEGFVEDPDPYIKSGSVIVCSGYLSILESFINKRPVVSCYGNDLKRDYLKLLPCYLPSYQEPSAMASALIKAINNPYIEGIEENYQFAKNNSWQKVADLYENAFKKIAPNL